jgi:hypothetical protein
MEKYSLKLMSLACLALTMALFAPQRALADDDDPPSRVARLGYTHGSISFQPAGTDDWVSAVVNRPITTGDKLWADNESRAELHIGSASLRISSNTGFSFLNLTDSVTQIQLTSGSLRVRVKRLDEDETFEIDTPNLAFSVLRPGTYRINVNEGGDATIITVRGGEGEVTGGGSAFTVHAHEVGNFNGTDQLTADVEGYQNDDDDDFDAWCADRDRHEDLSQSARYVSPDVIGYQDLDGNGDWRPVPEYGTVWFPRTTIEGWAPYRYGHWAYVYPWGYTWIDDAPWGFAPFHYGRWINYGGVWGWVPAPPPAPGIVYVRPVYAPALVAWVGGPHFGVGVSVGGGGGFAAGVNVGWFPLGPREVFVPSYPVSRRYVTNVNVSNTTVNTTVVNNYYNTTIVNRNTTVINNTTVIQQTYVNQRVAGAVTATTPQAFTSAQPVARNVVRVDVREVASAPVNAFTPPVAPAKQAVLGGAAVAVVKPPVAVQTRAVVAKVPPPPPPVAFARQQQAIQANGGRPLAVSQVRQIQPQNVQVAQPQVKIAPLSKPATPQNLPGNRPGQPLNVGGNAVNGNANGNRKTFEDRPRPAGDSNPVSNNGPSSNSSPGSNNKPAGNSNAGGGNNSPGGNTNAGGGNKPGGNSNPVNTNSPSGSNNPGGNNAGGANTKVGGNANPAGNAGPSGNNNPGGGNNPGGNNAGGANYKVGGNSNPVNTNGPSGNNSAGGNNKPNGNNASGGNSSSGGNNSPGGNSNAGGGNKPGGNTNPVNTNGPSGNNNAGGNNKPSGSNASGGNNSPGNNNAGGGNTKPGGNTNPLSNNGPSGNSSTGSNNKPVGNANAGGGNNSPGGNNNAGGNNNKPGGSNNNTSNAGSHPQPVVQPQVKQDQKQEDRHVSNDQNSRGKQDEGKNKPSQSDKDKEKQKDEHHR